MNRASIQKKNCKMNTANCFSISEQQQQVEGTEEGLHQDWGQGHLYVFSSFRVLRKRMFEMKSMQAEENIDLIASQHAATKTVLK